MERMEKKEKESGTLLGVGTAYLQAKEIKGVFYIKASDFNRCMDGIRIEQEADRKHIEQLEEENKKLKEELEWWKDLVHKAKEFKYDEDGMDYIYQNTENL